MRRSTCEIIDRIDTLVLLSEAESAGQIGAIIQAELQAEQVDQSEENVAEVAEAIIQQLDALSTTGTLDSESLSTFLLCLDV